MSARDLAADLAEEIFRRVPAKLSKSQSIEDSVEIYLTKELSPGLDLKIPSTQRLETIFTRYIKNLEFHLPRYLDELLDEDSSVETAQIIENSEEQSNFGESNLQATTHNPTDQEDISSPDGPFSDSGESKLVAPSQTSYTSTGPSLTHIQNDGNSEEPSIASTPGLADEIQKGTSILEGSEIVREPSESQSGDPDSGHPPPPGSQQATTVIPSRILSSNTDTLSELVEDPSHQNVQPIGPIEPDITSKSAHQIDLESQKDSKSSDHFATFISNASPNVDGDVEDTIPNTENEPVQDYSGQSEKEDNRTVEEAILLTTLSGTESPKSECADGYRATNASNTPPSLEDIDASELTISHNDELSNQLETEGSETTPTPDDFAKVAFEQTSQAQVNEFTNPAGHAHASDPLEQKYSAEHPAPSTSTPEESSVSSNVDGQDTIEEPSIQKLTTSPENAADQVQGHQNNSGVPKEEGLVNSEIQRNPHEALQPTLQSSEETHLQSSPDNDLKIGANTNLSGDISASTKPALNDSPAQCGGPVPPIRDSETKEYSVANEPKAETDTSNSKAEVEPIHQVQLPIGAEPEENPILENINSPPCYNETPKSDPNFLNPKTTDVDILVGQPSDRTESQNKPYPKAINQTLPHQQESLSTKVEGNVQTPSPQLSEYVSQTHREIPTAEEPLPEDKKPLELSLPPLEDFLGSDISLAVPSTPPSVEQDDAPIASSTPPSIAKGNSGMEIETVGRSSPVPLEVASTPSNVVNLSSVEAGNMESKVPSPDNVPISQTRTEEAPSAPMRIGGEVEDENSRDNESKEIVGDDFKNGVSPSKRHEPGLSESLIPISPPQQPDSSTLDRLDEIPENEKLEDDVPENEAPKDEVPENKIPEYEVLKDEALEDEVLKDEVPEDKVLEKEIPKDEAPKDGVPEDGEPEDGVPENEVPEDKNVKVVPLDSSSQRDPTSEETLIQPRTSEETLAQPRTSDCTNAFSKVLSPTNLHPYLGPATCDEKDLQEILTTPENTCSQPQLERLDIPSPREPPTATSTPDMEFDKQLTDSPLSESSTEITEYDDDTDFKPGPKMQPSEEDVPISVTKPPMDLGLLKSVPMEYETLALSPIDESEQVQHVELLGAGELLASSLHTDVQLPSSQLQESAPITEPLGEQRDLPTNAQTPGEVGSRSNPGQDTPPEIYETLAEDHGVKDTLDASFIPPVNPQILPAIGITSEDMIQSKQEEGTPVALTREKLGLEEQGDAENKPNIITNSTDVSESRESQLGVGKCDSIKELGDAEEVGPPTTILQTDGSSLPSLDLRPPRQENQNLGQSKVSPIETLHEDISILNNLRTEESTPMASAPSSPTSSVYSASESDTSLLTTASSNSEHSVDISADEDKPNFVEEQNVTPKNQSPEILPETIPSATSSPLGLLGSILTPKILPEWSFGTLIPPTLAFQIPSIPLPKSIPTPLSSLCNPGPTECVAKAEHTKTILDNPDHDQYASNTYSREISIANSEDNSLERHQDTLFIHTPMPGGFPCAELEALLCGEISSDLNISSELSPTENIWDSVWGQIIFFLCTILVQAWRPCFELIDLLILSSQSLGGIRTELLPVKGLLLESWTPGLVLLNSLFSLPGLLPEDIVPSSTHITQPSIELWVPVLEVIQCLLALLNSIPYHLMFSLSTYKLLASFILRLSSSIGKLRSMSLPPEFVAGLMEITPPHFLIPTWLKHYDETFSTLFRSSATENLLKDESQSSPVSRSPCCQSVSVCTCQILKSVSPTTDSAISFSIGFRFDPKSLPNIGCTNIQCSFSHLYLYLVLLMWVSEPAHYSNSAKSFGCILSSGLSIGLPILLHFKFSVGFPLSVLHLSYSSLRLLSNIFF
ncbi:hypothetical protein TWF281_010145 [Arthrobotrys megalospora]